MGLKSVGFRICKKLLESDNMWFGFNSVTSLMQRMDARQAAACSLPVSTVLTCSMKYTSQYTVSGYEWLPGTSELLPSVCLAFMYTSLCAAQQNTLLHTNTTRFCVHSSYGHCYNRQSKPVFNRCHIMTAHQIMCQNWHPVIKVKISSSTLLF